MAPVEIGWLGHATMLIDLDGVRLLTDPVLGGWTGPLRRIGAPVDLAALSEPWSWSRCQRSTRAGGARGEAPCPPRPASASRAAARSTSCATRPVRRNGAAGGARRRRAAPRGGLHDHGTWERRAWALRARLERGGRRGLAAIRAEAERPRGETVGRWLAAHDGTDPLARAAAARAARIADPPSGAFHVRVNTDGDGALLSGHSRYRLRFAPDSPPRVHGFWSLTTTGGVHSTGDL
jgi:hypothetical protein